jgi:hypothetical protein
VVFQASQDFSSSQGHRQWYYQYWDGRFYYDLAFDGASQFWRGPIPNLEVRRTSQHPAVGMDSVRKWVAPGPGRAEIRGQVRKSDTTGGDGVRAEVLHNARVEWVREIAGTDGVGHAVELSLDVAAGDAVYFRVNMRGATTNDGTTWDSQVLWVPRG